VSPWTQARISRPGKVYIGLFPLVPLHDLVLPTFGALIDGPKEEASPAVFSDHCSLVW
jgi:hypothetical protein